MSAVNDAHLNNSICLKQAPAPPIERWQMLPVARSKSTCSPGKTSQSQGRTTFSKTPERRLAIMTKSTPKNRVQSKTPTATAGGGQRSRTPGLHRTPKTPGRTSHTPNTATSDRYIPSRSTTDMGYSSFLVMSGKDKPMAAKEEREGGSDPLTGSPVSNDLYKQNLLDSFSQRRGHQQRGVLSYKSVTPRPSASHSYLEEYAEGASGYNSRTKSAAKSARALPISPEKVLDAPTIKDDYYLNTLDWGKNNILAVGLDSGVYLWNASDGSTHQLLDLNDDEYVSSLSWSGNGKFLAVGDSTACVQLWDVEKQKKIRTMKGHSDRVGVLAWNKHTVSSASRDGLILHNDVRRADHVVGRSNYHQLEVCGLQWSRDGRHLASGGNDNLACIWSASDTSQPAQILKGHQAAVKAVAWCPWDRNMIATGGGSSDKTIRFWNVSTGKCTKVVETKSQVSSLAWNKHHKQLVSAHGYPRNHMVVWSYPDMSKLSVLFGHTERILHMTVSPRRSRVASASSDETLRIWKCFKPMKLDEASYREESICSMLETTERMGGAQGIPTP